MLDPRKSCLSPTAYTSNEVFHTGYFSSSCALLRACELAITMMMMMMMMMTVQAILDFPIPHVFATFASWVVALTGQRKTLLNCASGSRRAENQAKCVRCGQIGPWTASRRSSSSCVRGAPDETRPQNRRQTSPPTETETPVGRVRSSSSCHFLSPVFQFFFIGKRFSFC